MPNTRKESKGTKKNVEKSEKKSRNTEKKKGKRKDIFYHPQAFQP